MLKRALSLVLALLMAFNMGISALALELETVGDIVPEVHVHDETAEVEAQEIELEAVTDKVPAETDAVVEPAAVAESDVAKIGDTGFATLADAVTAAAAGDTIVLLKDFSWTTKTTLTKKIIVKAEEGKPVTLTKEGTDELFLLSNANAELTLEGPITLVGTSGKYGSMIHVTSGTFIMNDGVTVKDNQTTEAAVGGAVTLAGKANFIMNGGTITNCGNTSTSNKFAYNSAGGGAVKMSSTKAAQYPTMVMNGGTISNCFGIAGGAVFVSNNYATSGVVSVTMNGGTISGCIAGSSSSASGAKGYGSAFFVFDKASTTADDTVVYIKGGEIKDNTAYQYGTLGMNPASTKKNAGKYIITGGWIHDNVVGNAGSWDGTPGKWYGQGIYVQGVAYDNDPLLVIGGDAKIEDEIYLANASTMIGVQDDFTGSASVFTGGYNLSANDGTGKAFAVPEGEATVSEEIAKEITIVNRAWDGSNFKVDPEGNYVLRYSAVADSASNKYILGEFKAEEEEVAPEAPNANNVTGVVYRFECYTNLDHPPMEIEFDTTLTEVGEPVKNDAGEWTCEVTHKVKEMWAYLNERIYAPNYSEEHAPHVELPETLTVTMKWDSESEKWVYNGEKIVYDISCELVAPEVPNGNNVTTNLVTMICDTDAAHEAVTTKWQSKTFVYPIDSQPEWDEELEAWTIGVRLDEIGTKYVWLHFEEKYNGINHDLVASDLVNAEYSRIDTKLKWDENAGQWVTLDGKPIEIHLTCQTKPEAPQMGYHLNQFQIKVVGKIDGEEKVWASSLDKDSIEVGEVKGNRADGFTADITVTLNDGDSYFEAWVAKHNPALKYVYDWSKTEKTVTFTMKYTGDTTGTIYDGPEYWTGDGEKVYTAYLTMEAPELPEKHGGNVTKDLVTVFCDSDPERHPSLTQKWYNAACKVYPTGSQPEWNEELGAFTIGIRIQQIDSFYTDVMRDNYNGIWHDHVNGVGSVEDDMIVATLMWDAAAQLWVPTETIELHTVCKAKPDAPIHVFMNNYQVQVNGDLDHDGVYGENGLLNDGVYEQYTTSIPEGAYTLSEVYGSREEGFFIDVTTTLEEGDIYFQNWVGNRANGKEYVYDWNLTEKEVKFTLKYTGDLTGTLWGTRSGEWVLPSTGNYWGVVAEAFVKEDIPAPYYDNVTEELVTVYCDSDPDRHQPVTGAWYRQHSKVLGDIVWNSELGAYTVEMRIDSLYTMYVSKLEKANGNTQHTIKGEDTRSIYTTLKWDAEQELWVPVEPIEIHTECRTAPLAPVYENQLESYQVKVHGDVNGEEQVWTVYIPESSMTVGEVYGSRDEGFFVDVTVVIEEDDTFITEWTAKKDPGMYYDYDWDKTPAEVKLTLKYTGDLNGTLHGDRYASNTNVDWVLTTSGKDFGVVADAYVEFATFVLTLDPNGGKVTPATINVTYNKAIGELPVPTYNKHTFLGWFDAEGNEVTAETIYTVPGDSTITAKWLANPDSATVVYNLFTFQCTEVHEHSWVCNWRPQVTFIKDSLKWNEELGRWEAQARIDSSTFGLVNNSNIKKNNFGGFTHHYDETKFTLDLYLDPEYTGLSSANKEVTGLWRPVKDYVFDVYCYTEPAAPSDATIQKISNVIWMRDAANTKNYLRSKLLADTYTVGEMYTENGKFYADLTVTNLETYIANFEAKFGEDYVIGDWAFNNVAKDFVFKLAYTGSTSDYKQDGTGWSIEYPNNTEKNNGKTLWLAKEYTVTYSDGAEGKVFEDVVYDVTVVVDTAKDKFTATTTPAMEDPTRTGYIFNGWTPEVAETVTEDVTYVAQWIRHPGSGSGNVTKELFTLQCTEVHEHAWLCNWFGSHVKLVKDSVTWNEELGRWEAQANVSGVFTQMNSTQPKKNYFGGFTHYADNKNQVVNLYYDPAYTGINSENKEVTGMWLPVQKYVFDVYCYTEPSMPNVSKITTTAIWVRDVANKATTHSQKFTVKQFVDGTYTLGEMYSKDGKFYVDLTVTDVNAYVEKLEAKTGKEYVVGDWELHYTAEDFKYTLEYTGSTTDYKQDGSGWSVAASSWANNSEKLNGKSLWVTEQFTVTYTDGAEGAYFADEAYTVNGFVENGANKNAVTDFSANTTPAFVGPAVRTGYTHTGWTPEVAETVTADVVYTAVWTANTYTVSFDANGGEAVAPITVTYDAPLGELPVTVRTGYTFAGWTDSEGNPVNAETVYTVAGDSTYVAMWTANEYTLNFDANGGEVDPASKVVVYDSAVGELPVPERYGYTFTGWTDSDGNPVNAETVYTVAGDSTYVAMWEKNIYTVVFDANGGGCYETSRKVAYLDEVGTLPVVNAGNRVFMGWYDADDNKVNANYVVTGNVTFYAKYAQGIIIDMGGNGNGGSSAGNGEETIPGGVTIIDVSNGKVTIVGRNENESNPNTGAPVATESPISAFAAIAVLGAAAYVLGKKR